MTNYTDYPFASNGVNFISRVMNDSPMATQISNLPQQLFMSMNAQAVREMIGDASLLTTAELLAELERLNEGGSHAFILLGANA